MGYSTFLRPKTRDDEIQMKIWKCLDKKKDKFLSDKFALFQSRFVFEHSEIKQVEEILSIDLSTYLKYPKNHFYDTGELEYKLYLAKEKNNFKEVQKIENQIEEEIKNWDLTYKTNNEDWSTIEEFRKVTLIFIEAINKKPKFGNEIIVPTVQHFPWGNYFSIKEKKDKHDDRILDDLNLLLFNLECIEKQGIEYVGFVWE